MSLITLCFGGLLWDFSIIEDVEGLIKNGEITYYVENVLDSEIDYIDAGIFKIVTMENGTSIDDKFSTVYGKSFKLKEGDNSLNKIQNHYRYNVVFNEKINDIKNVYAYSPLIKEFKTIKGKKVNMQIAFNSEDVIVGIPLILGSY